MTNEVTYLSTVTRNSQLVSNLATLTEMLDYTHANLRKCSLIKDIATSVDELESATWFNFLTFGFQMNQTSITLELESLIPSLGDTPREKPATFLTVSITPFDGAVVVPLPITTTHVYEQIFEFLNGYLSEHGENRWGFAWIVFKFLQRLGGLELLASTKIGDTWVIKGVYDEQLFTAVIDLSVAVSDWELLEKLEGE